MRFESTIINNGGRATNVASPLLHTLGIMNATETYDYFAIEFPPVHPEDHTWRNVHDGRTLNINALSEMIAQYIAGSRAVVVIHTLPGIGTELALSEVAGFVAPHILSAEIQIADPELSSFVAIARSGVATGWKVKNDA